MTCATDFATDVNGAAITVESRNLRRVSMLPEDAIQFAQRWAEDRTPVEFRDRMRVEVETRPRWPDHRRVQPDANAWW